MSASKPMSLLCLECVLQYMDANTRFRIAQRSPSIRSIEKRVPLCIKKLELSEYQFIVNDTCYRLGIYQDYPDELRIPDAVKKLNDQGGEQKDLDKYGINIYGRSQELTPGDIKIDNGKPTGGTPAFPPEIYRMERSLHSYQDELVRRDAPPRPPRDPSPYSSPEYEPVSPVYSVSSPAYSLTSPTYSPCDPVTDVEQLSKERLEEGIRSKNAELLPFLMRRDGEEPTWRLFAQLTISKGDSKVIYRGKYTTLAQNMKSIYTYFFGNRKHPISVGKLFVDCSCYYDAVLRLPENLKFKVSSLKFERKSRNVCEALAPIICESSFPLQQVEIEHTGGHPWIRTARSLKITVDHPRNALTTQYILSIECRKLKVKDRYSALEFTIADCIPVIEQWLTRGKAAGTCYKFAMQTTDRDILKGIANRFNGEYRRRKAKIPMYNFGLELHIGYKKTGDKNRLKMKVKQHRQ
ncbi:unnamed protein product [Caenorhabditis brenneri]